MHCCATERVHSSQRIDTRLRRQSDQLAEENKHILFRITLAVEFLAKQDLAFRGHRELCFSDFSCIYMYCFTSVFGILICRFKVFL